MPYEIKQNSGSVFGNEDKRPDRQMTSKDGSTFVAKDADFKGSALIDGKAYFVDMWDKVSQSGKAYRAIKFKEKNKQPGDGSPKASSQYSNNAPKVIDDFNDEIPF